MDLTIPGNSASCDHKQAENQRPSLVTAAIPRITRALVTNSTPTVFPGGTSHNALPHSPPHAQSSAVRAPRAPYSSPQQPISLTSSRQYRSPYSTSAHQGPVTQTFFAQYRSPYSTSIHQEPVTQTPSAQYRIPYQSLTSAQQSPATQTSSAQISNPNLNLYRQSRAAQYWRPSSNTISTKQQPISRNFTVRYQKSYQTSTSAQQQPPTQPVAAQSDSVAVSSHREDASQLQHLGAAGFGKASVPRLTYSGLAAQNTSSTSVVTPSSFVEYIPAAKRQKTLPAAKSRPGVIKPQTPSFVKKRAQRYLSSQSSLRQATSAPLLKSHSDFPDSSTEFQAVADMAGKKSVKNLLRDEGGLLRDIQRATANYSQVYSGQTMG